MDVRKSMPCIVVQSIFVQIHTSLTSILLQLGGVLLEVSLGVALVDAAAGFLQLEAKCKRSCSIASKNINISK